MLKKILPIMLAITLSMPTLAATDARKVPAKAEDKSAGVKEAMEAKLGTKISSVTKSPYLGLYEVFADGQILYTDEKLTAIIAGTLIDGQTMKNYSAERMQKLTAIKFSDLPLDLAVKQVRGNGKRIFATFEDPNCGYCKKLATDMGTLNNVTIYTFLYPILSPDSLDKSNQIWCSSDQAKAWNEWMQEGKHLTGKGDCDTTAVKKSVELGRKLAITGTPTLFFINGDRVQGAIPLAEIEKKLGQSSQ